MQQFDEQDYTQRFSLSLWRKILRYAKEYYPDLYRLVFTMAVTAGCDVAFPLMTTYAIDHFIPNLDRPGSMEGLPGFVAVYMALLVIQVAAIFYFLYLGGKIEVGVCYTIRRQAFRKLQELPFSYYDRMPVGYLMSRMTSDTQRLAETIGWSLLDLAWGAVMLAAASVIRIASSETQREAYFPVSRRERNILLTLPSPPSYSGRLPGSSSGPRRRSSGSLPGTARRSYPPAS